MKYPIVLEYGFSYSFAQ